MLTNVNEKTQNNLTTSPFHPVHDINSIFYILKLQQFDVRPLAVVPLYLLHMFSMCFRA